MRRFLENTVIAFAWLSGIVLLASILFITGHLLLKGAGTISPQLIFGDTPAINALLLREPVFDGLLPAIFGTFALIATSISIALPAGLSAGIYMAEYAPPGVKDIISLFIDILAGVPSIVVGLFGFSITLFLHKAFPGKIYPCLLISGLSLAFLVLPYIIRSTQISLENLPKNVRLTGLSLGATTIQNIIYILIPRSLPGIISGIILAVGRCAEDTAVIMMTGVVATAGIPGSLLSQYEALPFYIYYISSEYSSQQELLSGYGASLILLFICAALFSVAFFIKRKLTHITFYRV